ncbi:MAG: shikimate kinase [Deltaproteobacteria bacterium]|nr:shikimate kinase [Deltaproteobacteria bacterium]
MKADQHLILTGFMGSGKSSVGKELATLLQRPFIDLDKYIEKQTGLTIAEIFEHQGEIYFRRLEQQSLKTVLAYPPLVLATGGGTIINEDNRRLIKNRGYIVFLDASQDTIMKRTGASHSRPLLLTGDKTTADRFRQQKIKDLLNERRSFYELCHLKILTDNLSVNQVTRRILQQLPSAPD